MLVGNGYYLLYIEFGSLLGKIFYWLWLKNKVYFEKYVCELIVIICYFIKIVVLLYLIIIFLNVIFVIFFLYFIFLLNKGFIFLY